MRSFFCVAACLVLLVGSLASVSAQQSGITLTDIWSSRELFPSYFPGFQWHEGGKSYLEQTEEGLVYFDTKTGAKKGILMPQSALKFEGKDLEADDFNVTESGKILVSTKSKGKYRHSKVAEYFIYNPTTKSIAKADPADALEENATLSPDGKFVAYMRENNVFTTNLATGTTTQVTTDGKLNEIINGACDWVYEEEFEFAQAIYWSPDSKRIAFYRFDERQVPEYNMQIWKGLYPKDYRYKYPKAGEKNSNVTMLMYNVETARTAVAASGTDEHYIARAKWTKDPNNLAIIKLNRLQNKYEILHANASTGACNTVYTETSNTYVEVNDNLTYLPDGKGFITTSERDGFAHIYHYSIAGKLLKQITTGKAEVLKLHGIEPTSGKIFYSAHGRNAYQTEVYATSLKGGKPVCLTPLAGTHDAEFSPDFSFFLDTYSTANTPPTGTLLTQNGAIVKVLEENQTLKTRMRNMALSPVQFLDVPSGQDTLRLNAFVIKPLKMEAGKRYPVLMFCYGGPGAQTVEDQFGGPNFFWYQMLAQQGYIVLSADNRGTGGRGVAFKKATYGKLGRLESDDQAAVATWLKGLPYVDGTRIGIWGWSFGGYLTSLCLTRYPDLFKAGIAVAPVTNWRFYDSIYTERYLGLPAENPSGYDDNSPAKLADKMKAKYMLVHGTGDDNVHFQNAVEMVNGLVAANIPFQSAYYPDRNHGISGGKTRLHLYTAMTQFLLKEL